MNPPEVMMLVALFLSGLRGHVHAQINPDAAIRFN